MSNDRSPPVIEPVTSHATAGTQQELADEAAYTAIFVLARSQARGRSCARTAMTTAVAAGALAIGGATAVAMMLGDPRDGSPHPRDSVQFGVPAAPRARADRDAPAQPSQQAAQARACPAPSRADAERQTAITPGQHSGAAHTSQAVTVLYIDQEADRHASHTGPTVGPKTRAVEANRGPTR